ncbi:UTP--glucose-1-phosphate uridylyltransferase [Micropruina sonneratiae]|uniref:UTP--glucose-1-phosphate uridylyltransferase n=1 Tax=Micropruina sonneratiae TaxID=2986940 RepID=UPI002226C38A|nr:UTP--glucose-1-phosphate uridylyltransferase [Micropruina sp. KQZ13P-5]MCW3158907.1 UTP--glucose-1-phosphate uridylyltransferase [Micropruina sp. KQZ13P-5]
MTEHGLAAAIAKMKEAGANEPAIDVFSHYYRQASDGVTGMIPEDTITPLTDPPQLSAVSVDETAARDAIARTVIIKLNGGLGTSMGLDQAKTLLPVREGLTFLDLIVQQIMAARETYAAPLPLLFMNSFRTREDTLAHLERYPDLAVGDLPVDFLQNAEPKIRQDDFEPVEWPDDPTLEWCPPGHGDVYTALVGSGVLDALLAAGMKYASISNGDNLGAAPDAELAGWFAGTGAPYAAEICPRTINDRKGGHLAIRKSDGQLILRDTAQTPADDMDYFTDEHRHPYFHTNNLWVDLEQLKAALEERGAVLGLPLIYNVKTVDPSDSSSPKVIQLETAMGAAIEVFNGATAIAVPRSRFQPVKTTNELLLLRSDVFDLGADSRLTQTVESLPRVDLDADHYKLIGDFEQRVKVAPSLKAATSFVVEGDWTFDSEVTVTGDVTFPDLGRPAVAGVDDPR